MSRLHRSDSYRGVVEALAMLGLAHSVAWSGKHPKVRVATRGRPITIVVSATPSDGRVRKNMCALTLRLLREAGEGRPRA